MNLLFAKTFSKDLDKLTDFVVKDRLRLVLEQLESVASLKSVSQVKKLKGSKNAYRIRIGDYRLGFFLMENQTITLVQFIHRKDIYDAFP